MSSKRRGRPARRDEPSSTRINLRVTPAERLELRRVAAANGTGLSGVIREAVLTYCADYDERIGWRRR